MPWNSTAPVGSVSVKANRTILGQNTTYIESTMGTSIVGTNTVTTRDHFWNVDANLDGRHRFIQSPAFTVATIPANPVVGTGMDSVFYSKLKLAAEAVAQQDVQPFFRNATANIMQVLGIRACAVFDKDRVILYSHNVSSVTGSGSSYVINFTTPLPSSNYLVFPGGMRKSSGFFSSIIAYVDSGPTLATNKTVNFVNLKMASSANNTIDIIQDWVLCFGG